MEEDNTQCMEDSISATSNRNKEHKFLWIIENYSYCWHKNGEELCSPKFTTRKLEDTAWYLHLYPRGERKGTRGYISIYLFRSNEDGGPADFSFNCELSVLAADGSAPCAIEFESTFERGTGYGMQQLILKDEVLLNREADYLVQDTLRVCCKIWQNDDNYQIVGETTAVTRIGMQKISFLHVVKDFAELEPDQKKTNLVKSPAEEECSVSTSLYFVDSPCNEGTIIVEILPSSTKYNLTKLKLSLLDRFGNIIECGEVDNRFGSIRIDIQKLPLSITRRFILDRKSEYLPNDELSVLCECAFSAGIKFETITELQYDLPLAVYKQKNNDARNKADYKAEENISACPNALDDMITIYNNKCLTDVEIKTETKSFPAHKVVLCARSPVFKAMLTNDMKEKNTDCIQVDDLDDDTVEQLLLFLYSDNLKNKCWESVAKLYYAADKYAVEKLKLLCSDILIKNLNISNASEILVLSDAHSDSYLKNFTEDFILNHEMQVFGSGEWEKVVETNHTLALKTMLLKYK